MQPAFPSLQEKLDPCHTAVVVVDVQNDFCHAEDAASGARSGPGLYNGTILRESLPHLLDGARRASALRVFVRMINDRVYLSPPVAERLARVGRLDKGPLSGTWGADYWENIRPAPDNPREIEVIKHRYSAFHGTRLDLILRRHGIRTLVFTGVATSGCVESTAREGLFHDYYVLMVRDCVADGDRESHDASLRKFSRSFGEVADSREILEIWRGIPSPPGSGVPACGSG